jgi:hypothetical protein
MMFKIILRVFMGSNIGLGQSYRGYPILQYSDIITDNFNVDTLLTLLLVQHAVLAIMEHSWLRKCDQRHSTVTDLARLRG